MEDLNSLNQSLVESNKLETKPATSLHELVTYLKMSNATSFLDFFSLPSSICHQALRSKFLQGLQRWLKKLFQVALSFQK